MGSQIVAVRKNLIAALATLPAFTTTGPTGQKPDFSFGWKDPWKKREKVWTQRARFEHSPASLRATKTFTEETGYFDLLLFVHGVGLTQEVTSERVADLQADAWDFIQTHANWHNNAMGVGLKEFVVDGDGQVLEGLDSTNQPMAELTLPIRYKARLT